MTCDQSGQRALIGPPAPLSNPAGLRVVQFAVAAGPVFQVLKPAKDLLKGPVPEAQILLDCYPILSDNSPARNLPPRKFAGALPAIHTQIGTLLRRSAIGLCNSVYDQAWNFRASSARLGDIFLYSAYFKSSDLQSDQYWVRQPGHTNYERGQIHCPY
jgi:hypothetical protein